MEITSIRCKGMSNEKFIASSSQYKVFILGSLWFVKMKDDEANN